MAQIFDFCLPLGSFNTQVFNLTNYTRRELVFIMEAASVRTLEESLGYSSGRERRRDLRLRGDLTWQHMRICLR